MLLLALSIAITVLPLCNILNAAGTESASTWTKLANMPTSRGGLGTAVVSGKIYAIGGLNSTGDLAINELYDPLTDKWTNKTSMPTARTGFATAVYENKIYVIGGAVGDTFTGNVEVYDTINDTWQAMASMPTPRADLTANIVDDKIYLIGGKIYSNTSPYYSQTSVTQVYDIKTNTWSTSNSMPTALQGYASTVIGTKIYIIGGSRQSLSGIDTSTSTLQIYDTKTNSWTTGQPLNYPSSYGAAVATTGVIAPTKIYYVGGFSVEAFSDKTQIYDVENDFWSEGPKMSTTKAYLGLAIAHDIIYAIGGLDGDKWLNSIEELKPIDYGKVPPIIEIISPVNKTYKNIQIDYRVNKAVSWVGYSIDNGLNITLTRNSYNIDNILDGPHSIRLFANDTSGNMGASQIVHFTIDNLAPTVTVLMPLKQTYNTADVILTFVIDKPVTHLSYSINGQPEIPITGNITLPALSDGKHVIVVHAVDELGNSGSSEEIFFTISTFPTFWVATAIVLVIILLTTGYLVFKHTKFINKSMKMPENEI
jgi:N-acetylneuraminic acid mutarotase